MIFSYVILVIITWLIYNSLELYKSDHGFRSYCRFDVWIGDCGRGCLTNEDIVHSEGIRMEAMRCTCDVCFCTPIQTYGVPLARVCNSTSDTISKHFSSYSDMFHDWYKNSNCGRRHAQLSVTKRPSLYSESIEEFTLVPDADVEEKQIPKKKATICETTTTSTSVTECASVTQAVSDVTQYGYDLVGKMVEIALNIEPEVLLAPIRSKLSTCSSTSARSKVDEPEEKLDTRRNCSKCVEKGLTCVRGCPIAKKKRKKDNEQ